MAGLEKPITDTSTGKTCLQLAAGGSGLFRHHVGVFFADHHAGRVGIGVDDLGPEGGVSDAKIVYSVLLQEVVYHNLGNRRP